MKNLLIHLLLGLVTLCCALPADAEIITEVSLSVLAYADHREGSDFGDLSEAPRTHPSYYGIGVGASVQGSSVRNQGTTSTPFDFTSDAFSWASGLANSDGSGFMTSYSSAGVTTTLESPHSIRDSFSNNTRATSNADVWLRGAGANRHVYIRGDVRRDSPLNSADIKLEQDTAATIFKDVTPGLTASRRVAAAGVWTLDLDVNRKPIFPGTDPTRALPGIETFDPRFESDFESIFETESVHIPQQVTGTFLAGARAFVAPVQEEYGTTDRLFFQGAEASLVAASSVIEASSAAASPLGYFFSTLHDSPLFASFSLADIAPDRSYDIFFDGIRRTLLGSEVIDFTAFDPDGVSSFYLSGLDGHDGNGIPYTFSTTFMNEGTAQFAVGSVMAPAAVPEPSSLVLLGLSGFVGAGSWFRKRRKAVRSLSAIRE